jgi:hypothetical protein
VRTLLTPRWAPTASGPAESDASGERKTETKDLSVHVGAPPVALLAAALVPFAPPSTQPVPSSPPRQRHVPPAHLDTPPSPALRRGTSSPARPFGPPTLPLPVPVSPRLRKGPRRGLDTWGSASSGRSSPCSAGSGLEAAAIAALGGGVRGGGIAFRGEPMGYFDRKGAVQEGGGERHRDNLTVLFQGCGGNASTNGVRGVRRYETVASRTSPRAGVGKCAHCKGQFTLKARGCVHFCSLDCKSTFVMLHGLKFD